MNVLVLVLAILVGFIFYSQQSVATANAMSRAARAVSKPAAGRSGFGEALAVFGGALAGDAMWAAAALVLFFLAQQLAPARVILSIVGSFFFLRLAWGALQDARQGIVPRTDLPADKEAFQTGAQISFKNPYALGFWLGASAATLLLLSSAPSLLDFVLFYVGIVVGAALWSLLIAWLAARQPGALSTGFFRTVNVVAGVAAALLGVAVLWATVTQPVVASPLEG